MTDRFYSRTLASLSGLVVLLGAMAIPSYAQDPDNASGDPPNVIMFVVDDLNDWVGVLGHQQAITPSIDRLADAGVIFRNAHAPGVFCAPSRTAIWTGLQATTTGCYDNEVFFYDYPEVVTLQMAFQEAGYHTYAAG